MGTFEVTSRQKIGFNTATSARSNISADTNAGAVGRAVSEAGGELKRVVDAYQTKVANTEFSEYKEAVKLDDVKMKDELGREFDSSQYPAIYKAHEEYRKTLMPKSQLGHQAATLWNNSRTAEYAESLLKDQYARAEDNWQTHLGKKISLLEQGIGNIDDVNEFIRLRQAGPDPLPNSVVAKLKAKAGVAEVKGRVAGIKSLAIKDGVSEEERANLFNKARDIIQTNSAYNSQDAFAEVQSINILEQQLINRSKKNRFNYDVANNVNNAERLGQNQLTLDDVREQYPTGVAGGNNADSKRVAFWNDVIEGSTKSLPTQSSGTGFGRVNDILREVSTGAKDELSATNELLAERYVERTISQETFDWAIKRVSSPYPKPLAKMINNIMSQKEDAIRRAEDSHFYTRAEKKRVGEKVQEANNQLFRWIDATLEKDPEHVFTPKEIYNMDSQILATTPSVVIDPNIAPETKDDFYNNVAELKAKDTDKAKEYYNKWKDTKWQ